MKKLLQEYLDLTGYWPDIGGRLYSGSDSSSTAVGGGLCPPASTVSRSTTDASESPDSLPQWHCRQPVRIHVDDDEYS